MLRITLACLVVIGAMMLSSETARASNCTQYAHLCASDTPGLRAPARKAQRVAVKPGRTDVRRAVSGKTVAINRGLGGQLLAPMGNLARAAAAKGYRVSMDADPNGKTLVIAHSISCLGAVQARAGKIILIDCPIWFWGRTSRTGNCTHYVTAGHPTVGNCRNIRIAGGHVSAPYTAASRIIGQM